MNLTGMSFNKLDFLRLFACIKARGETPVIADECLSLPT